MCTVTYLPTPTGYIISSNRDESPLRAETPVTEERMNGVTVLFPKDSKGGSWIFKDDGGRSVVVLNGAFFKHKYRPPYNKSRGLIAKEYFSAPDTIHFIKNLELQGIEPFTMIIHDGKSLIEFRWDEDLKYIATVDQKIPHIWSSSTLYDQKFQDLRERWFYNHLPSEGPYDLATAQYIHHSGDVGDASQNYIMNRDNVVRTISISHVVVEQRHSSLIFNPLI